MMRKSDRSIQKLADFYDGFRVDVEKFGAKVLSVEDIYTENDDFSAFELDSVRRNFLVDFGEYGFHLPEFDKVIYDAETYDVLAVIFSSSDIAWGIVESAYWKMKYDAAQLTKHIKVYFVASRETGLPRDEQKISTIRNFQMELDGCYTLFENHPDDKIQMGKLNKLMDDAKLWLKKV